MCVWESINMCFFFPYSKVPFRDIDDIVKIGKQTTINHKIIVLRTINQNLHCCGNLNPTNMVENYC